MTGGDWTRGAEAMRAAIVANLQGWVNNLKHNNGEATLVGCAYAGAREVARCTLRPAAPAPDAELRPLVERLLNAETHPLHVGYDDRNNYAYVDVIRTDDEAFVALKRHLS